MGLDYQILIVLGIKVPVEHKEVTIFEPRFDIRTGKRVKDASIRKDVIVIKDFVTFEDKDYFFIFDSETVPELKEFSFYEEAGVIGEQIGKSDYVDGGKTCHAEIPFVSEEKFNDVRARLNKMGIHGQPKIYSILSVSY